MLLEVAVYASLSEIASLHDNYKGSSVPVMGNTVIGVFWFWGVLLGVLCIW